MEATLIADRYEVIRPLGRGSFAQTLLARDTSLDRLVAVKVLHPRAAPDWKAFDLFDREAVVLRGLRHQGIPAVHEALRAQWDGTEAAFLVMEYVEGVSMAQLMEERRHLDPAEVLQLFLEMLGVLDYLHTRVPPILHRDIKPANVIVRPDGSPALVDFGAVRNVFRRPDESGSTIVGTYGYMPYEQMMGQAVPSSDLYALAATFLQLITGRAPPEFMTPAGRLAVPKDLSCGEPLRGVLARMLAAAPAERFTSARAARNALLGGIGATAVALSPTTSSTSVTTMAAAAKLSPLITPAPRTFDPQMKELLRAVVYSPGRILASTEKGGAGASVADVFLLGLFSVLTAGVLPAVVWSMYRARKKIIKRFLLTGQLTAGRVLDMTEEKAPFEIKLTRVRYEFEADGQTHRDSDLVLPVIAMRWDRGTPVQVLYQPGGDYDSVIISTS
ncbi:MAG: serine/threonine-protein kinase [Longimicrobiales bacterium]